MQTVPALDRLGTESAFSVLARAADLQAAGRDIVNLGIGQPDFPTPPNIVEAGVRALRDGHHGYTPARGIAPLREAVAADVAARRGVEIDPGHILIMPGGKPTMFFALSIFGQAGAEIVHPDPGFPIYRSMIRYSGATPVPVSPREADGFAFRAADILAAITERTRLVILNSPGNPTGGVTSRAETDALAEGLERWPDVAILSDEIYSRMIHDGGAHVSLMEYPALRDRLIVLDGWSKTYAMTGWRLGWSLWPGALVDAAERLCVNCHSCVNAATQYAGIEALTGPQDAVAEMMAAFGRRRRLIVDLLNEVPGVRCPEPGGAFYVFPNVEETGLDGRRMQTRLLEEAGVAAIAGTSFGDTADGNIRFSYANSEENICTAVARMRDLLS